MSYDRQAGTNNASQATLIHAPHLPTHYQPISGELWAVIGFAACFWLFVFYRFYRGTRRCIGWMNSHE